MHAYIDPFQIVNSGIGCFWWLGVNSDYNLIFLVCSKKVAISFAFKHPLQYLSKTLLSFRAYQRYVEVTVAQWSNRSVTQEIRAKTGNQGFQSRILWRCWNPAMPHKKMQVFEYSPWKPAAHGLILFQAANPPDTDYESAEEAESSGRKVDGDDDGWLVMWLVKKYGGGLWCCVLDAMNLLLPNMLTVI